MALLARILVWCLLLLTGLCGTALLLTRLLVRVLALLTRILVLIVLVRHCRFLHC